MAHYEENLADPPLLDGALDRSPIEGAFFDCIPSASASRRRWEALKTAEDKAAVKQSWADPLKLGTGIKRPNEPFPSCFY